MKGKAKEAVGTAAGRDLLRERKAQQDKARAHRDAAKKEAKLRLHASATTAEKRQQQSQ